jgi:hypothetical protein
MAALFEGATRSPLPGPPGETARTSRPVDPAGVTAGLAYVNRCLRGHRPFGIITGSTEGLKALVDRVTANCDAREDLHTLRITVPTDSVQTFLATCLAQLGFELREAALDDLHNLMVVFLRHEGARGRRTVAIIEDTDQYGPRVLEFMQTLSKVRAGATPAMTFVLAGSPGLHRILDSRGMATLRLFTRERFDLDRSLAWVSIAGKATALVGPWSSGKRVDTPAVATDAAPRQLVVMQDGVIIERRLLTPGRLVIGRGSKCDLRLDSRYVSRHHAVLTITPDEVFVVDLRSTNTTLVNGQVTASQKLEHGDLLAIGNFRLRYDFRLR